MKMVNDRRRRAVRAVRGALLQLALGFGLTLVLGLALGFLSRDVFVIGLVPLVLGLAAGAAVGLLALLNGGPWRATAYAVAAIAIAGGWIAFQVMEDHHFRELFREQVARSRAAGDLIPSGLMQDPEGLAFLSRDAERLLEAAAIEQVGQGGAVGRWRMRAERGVRLVGPMVGGRALPVGQAGALVWLVMELALAGFVSTVVLRRLARAAAARSAGLGPGDGGVPVS